MSLKWLIGGEVNHKFIEKKKNKEYNQWIEDEKQLDAKVVKNWNNSNKSVEYKIKKLIEINKTDPDFPKRFFARHPELVPPELNPFLLNKSINDDNETMIKQLEKAQKNLDELIVWNKNIQEKNQELLEQNKELKNRIKKYEQSQ